MSILVAALLLAPAMAHAGAPAWIEIYSGWATPGGGLLVGRVHDGTRPAESVEGARATRRLRQTLQSLDADPLAGVAVTVVAGNQPLAARTDKRGYFDVTLPPKLAGASVHVIATLGEPGYSAAPAIADLPIFADGPGYGVISDVDDTLIDTGVTHKLRMAERTLFGSRFTLRAFPEAAATLTAIAGDARPLVYISGSPWALHQRIADYFEQAGFPNAAFVMKRFSSEPMTDQMAYKWPHTIALADSLPARRWICFGDSTESDPEIYARLARERPGRVAAIYIHLVTDEKPDSPRFAGMNVFRDWRDAAADLAQKKLTTR